MMIAEATVRELALTTARYYRHDLRAGFPERCVEKTRNASEVGAIEIIRREMIRSIKDDDIREVEKWRFFRKYAQRRADTS